MRVILKLPYILKKGEMHDIIENSSALSLSGYLALGLRMFCHFHSCTISLVSATLARPVVAHRRSVFSACNRLFLSGHHRQTAAGSITQKSSFSARRVFPLLFLWDLFPLLLMGKDALFSYCSALAPALLFGCSLCAGIVCRFCLHLFQTWLTRRHTVETK